MHEMLNGHKCLVVGRPCTV